MPVYDVIHYREVRRQIQVTADTPEQAAEMVIKMDNENSEWGEEEDNDGGEFVVFNQNGDEVARA